MSFCLQISSLSLEISTEMLSSVDFLPTYRVSKGDERIENNVLYLHILCNSIVPEFVFNLDVLILCMKISLLLDVEILSV